jgi:hypothetical protein
MNKSRMTFNSLSQIIIYLSYLILLFPFIVVEGLFKNQPILGDPFYLARMKETSFLSLNQATPYVSYNSNFGGKVEILSLGELMLGKLGLVFNLQVAELYIFSSLLIGLLILFLAQKVLKEIGIIGVNILIFLILGIFIFWGPFFPYSLERPISPQIILLVWLWFILNCLREIKMTSYKTIIKLGFISGLSAYLHYPYIFLQIQAGTIIFIIGMFLFKKPVKGFLLSTFISWVVAWPHLLWSRNAALSQDYQDLLLRGGIIYNHIPTALSVVIFSIIALILIFMLLKRSTKVSLQFSRMPLLFLFSQVVGCILVSNSNIVTGVSVQFSDHFDIFIKSLLLIIGAVVFKVYLPQVQFLLISKKVKYIFPALILFSSLLYAFGNEGSGQEQRTGIDTIVSHIPTNNAILVDDDGLATSASALLLNKTLTDYNIINYNFPQKEINQRYYVQSGCTIKNVSEIEYFKIYSFRLISERRKLSRIFQNLPNLEVFSGIKRALEGRIDYLIAEEEILLNEALDDFTEIDKSGCIDFLRARGVRYIVSTSPVNWLEYRITHQITEVKVDQHLTIYRIVIPS